MLTAGVDLAAEPKNTGMATIVWSADRAEVVDLAIDVDDAGIVLAAGNVAKMGIDCPLGWPDTFVQFLRDFHEGSHVTIPTGADRKWRKSLANRETDLDVHRRLGLTPLSVATDRIGLTAMRAASIQSALTNAGHPVDRTGGGLLVEVYPTAALLHWEMKHHRQYKGARNEAALGELVDGLPLWLDLGDHEALCRRSDHAFDAVIAALVARAAAIGHTRRPSATHLDAATREGWIALPTGPMDQLVQPGA
jgi:predicted nuclease with RNAse H fold